MSRIPAATRPAWAGIAHVRPGRPGRAIAYPRPHRAADAVLGGPGGRGKRRTPGKIAEGRLVGPFVASDHLPFFRMSPSAFSSSSENSASLAATASFVTAAVLA